MRLLLGTPLPPLTVHILGGVCRCGFFGCRWLQQHTISGIDRRQQRAEKNGTSLSQVSCCQLHCLARQLHGSIKICQQHWRILQPIKFASLQNIQHKLKTHEVRNGFTFYWHYWNNFITNLNIVCYLSDINLVDFLKKNIHIFTCFQSFIFHILLFINSVNKIEIQRVDTFFLTCKNANCYFLLCDIFFLHLHVSTDLVMCYEFTLERTWNIIISNKKVSKVIYSLGI